MKQRMSSFWTWIQCIERGPLNHHRLQRQLRAFHSHSLLRIPGLLRERKRRYTEQRKPWTQDTFRHGRMSRCIIAILLLSCVAYTGNAFDIYHWHIIRKPQTNESIAKNLSTRQKITPCRLRYGFCPFRGIFRGLREPSITLCYIILLGRLQAPYNNILLKLRV